MKTIQNVSLKVLSLMMALTMLVSMVSIGAFTADAYTVNPTPIVRQNLAKWKNYTYGDPVNGTLYRTGCGMFAIVNAVGFLTGNEMSVTEVAAWGHSIGGYNPGSSHAGTYRGTIYPRLQAKYGTRYGFTVDCNGSDGYWAGSSSTKLKNHLANGGVAIGHVPGHFIAIVDWDGASYHLYDSYPTAARGTNSNAGTGLGDCWVSPSKLASGKLKLDWFCLLSRTGTVINNQVMEKTYTVTFDSRGGSSVKAQTVEEGKYATKPTPTRDGFEFLGWYDEDGYEFLFDTTAIWANRSLHAEWRAITWPQTTDYMPTGTNFASEACDTGSVWTYFNPSSGAATLYKAGEGYGWPSAIATHQTSVDLSKYAYLNISLNATAQFNAAILFRDTSMNTHVVKLSQIINGTDADFQPGQYVLTANVGNYLYSNGDWTLPADGVVNIEAIRYFVIGNETDYVNLYGVCFSGEQNYLDLMNPDTIVQEPIAGATGSYTYDKGVLNIQGTAGYTVSFYPNVSYAPQQLANWIVSVQSGANFDVSMVVTTSEGDKYVSLVSDYYNVLGFTEYPELGLNPGQYSRSFNLLGMYEWNGILPADGQSVIKKVSFELRSEGDGTLYAVQMCDAPVTKYFTDDVVKSGSWQGYIDITNTDYVLNRDTDVLVGAFTDLTVSQAKNGMNNGQYVRLFDNGTEVTDTAVAKTGLTVRVMNGDTLISEYTLAIRGDVDRNGAKSTSDVRNIMLSVLRDEALPVDAEAAADMNGDAEINTTDAKLLMLAMLSD